MRISAAISAYLGIDERTVIEITDCAPTLYRRYFIPKKQGGGSREIYHPAKETKTIQTAAIDLLDRNDLVHDCVKGYVRGMRSPLLKNASAHAQKLFLLRLDFSDFFPSIKPDDFKPVCGHRLTLNGRALDTDDIDFLCRLFFVFNRRLGWFLGIGAPSSPFISNWVMYDLDRTIMAASQEMGCTYTRYADDLCFSSDSKSQLLDLEKKVSKSLKDCPHPRLELNQKKRFLASKWSRRRVTGLTITPQKEVMVPRKMKRYIRSLLNKYKAGIIGADEKGSLAGYLAFLNDCEPYYFKNLVLKYGADIVQQAFRVKR